MANLLRTDSSDFRRPADDQGPIVLARLPRVGAEQPTTATKVQRQVVPPPPEHIPYLDLQADIDRQTRLHIADTTSDASIPNTRHFADRRHTEPATVSTSTVRTKQPATHEPATLSEKLFQLHAKVAPHAGLIVALALIASAGLLYWMIVGPAQPAMPQYDYGTEFSDEGFGSISNYTPEFIAEMPQTMVAMEPGASPAADEQWEEVFRSTPRMEQQPNEFERTESAEPLEAPPTLKPTSLQQLPTTDDSPYPTTEFPHALPFAELQQAQPTAEFANRPGSTTTR